MDRVFPVHAAPDIGTHYILNGVNYIVTGHSKEFILTNNAIQNYPYLEGYRGMKIRAVHVYLEEE